MGLNLAPNPALHSCVHLLTRSTDEAPEQVGWLAPPIQLDSGRIGRGKIEQYLPPPAPDVLLFVCGVPAMYDELCGPRTEKDLPDGCVLQAMGYTSEMVAKM